MKQAALTKRRVPLRVLPAPDLPFLMLVLTLVGFGLVMLGSASGAVALYRRGDALAYLRPQMLYAAMGIAGMGLASRVDYHIFHKLAWPLLAVSLVLLAAVLFMPEYNGCKRWLVLPGLGTLQPSEIAKFAVVLVFSHIISLNHDRMQSFAVGVLPFALVLGVVAALMLLEPHLSGTLLILGIGAVLMFVGGTGLRWFVLAGVGGAAAIATAVILMPELVPYAADRLRSWQDPFADPLGDGHQTIQSLYAIGSGGATGLGLGNSRQKHLFVPEPQNDFIFSIVCEELGFVGACAVVGLFVLLLWRGIAIAAKAPDRFGALLVVGFVVQVALQAVLNVAVVTNTIPNTGISLPFFLLRRHQPDDAAGRNGNRLVGFERRDLKSPNKLDGRSDPNIQPSFRILWGIFCEMGAAFMENRIVVTGGRPLNGAVRIPAAKKQRASAACGVHAVLGEGAAAGSAPPFGCGGEPCTAAGSGVRGPVGRGGSCPLRPAENRCASGETAEQMRASILFCAPLLAKLGRAETNLPGGCRIGARPIDLHLAGLRQMGAVEWDAGPGRLVLTAPSGLHGAEITLRFPSVGATETLVLAAACAKGTTVLRGAAREPEITDLAEFLNRCGAAIQGAGSSTIRIEGRRNLSGCIFSPLPDRIFASTLACAAAAAGGRAELLGCPAGLYAPVLEILEQMGCRVEAGGESVRVSRFGRLYGAGRVFTGVYPALATDAAPLLAAAMLCAEGESSIEDVIFERRFGCAVGFESFGAKVRVDGRTLSVAPGSTLRGAAVEAPDLRGGAALVLAALAASGTSVITHPEHIDRGYAAFTEILASLGAQIRREAPLRNTTAKKPLQKAKSSCNRAKKMVRYSYINVGLI